MIARTLVTLALIALGAPASAHHSFAAFYFEDQSVSIEGVVTEFHYVNPHAWVYISARDVEGVVGAPSSVSPLTAKTQADRDLVALLFAGLVRNGPGGTLVPDLAERWSVDASGKTWTVDLREDARWHDGTPVTPDDVIFTIETLQDPAYTGPSATSWSEVTVATTGPRQVRFTLKTPLGGFMQE